MNKISRNGNWFVLMAGIVCLLGAVVMAQRDGNEIQQPLKGARDLSVAFRQASKRALPSVVAIETVSRPSRLAEGTGPEDFFRGTPFEEQFKSDPRFRQFFEQRTPRQRPRQEGRGSGFVIDSSGIIMTNSHVVRGADKVTVRFQDGREYVAKDIKFDERADVAILRVDADEPLTALPVGDSDALEVGDWVLAIGSPFGFDMSVTAGIISAKGRGHISPQSMNGNLQKRDDFLQTDAAVNPGNSGGPLINLNGEVVGINTAISTRSGGYDGVSFAVPINMADWIGRQLVDNGKVQRAYLGVVIQPVDNDLARVLGTRVGEGALVNEVRANSPAERAKMQEQDVILKVNGEKVTSTLNLQNIVEQLEIGKSYPVEVLRDGKRVQLTMTAEAMPGDFAMINSSGRSARSDEQEEVKPEAESFDELGIEIEELTAETAEKLGIEGEAGKGVLITEVKPDSPADERGLQPGMIIEKVGTKSVKDLESFATALKDSSLEKGVLLLIRRGGGKQHVVVKKS